MQLCHPELRIDFRGWPADDVAHGLPVHLTRFVGRGAQISGAPVGDDNRLVTLTGAGGMGKTAGGAARGADRQ